jgi:AAA domain
MNAPKPSTPRERRMTLSAVSRGVVDRPYRILLGGLEGVGKSTFGANAPSPIFLGAEDGTGHLDVARFPGLREFQDARDAVRELRDGKHDYQTLVIDTLDWLEPHVWAAVCAEGGKKSIEDFGFGKGYIAAVDTWRLFLRDLEDLQRERRMHLVMLAHTHRKTFKNPEGADYDRFELKLHEKTAGLVKEWVEAVLFARYEEFLDVEKTRSGQVTRARAYSTGARVIMSQRTAAYDAKSRYPLPERLPLSWVEFDKAARSGQDPEQLRAELERVISQLRDDIADRARGAVKAAGDDAGKLSQILNHARLQPAKEDKTNAS